MHPNGQRLESPDVTHFIENQNKIPLEYLLPYAGRYVAWNPEGTKILASGKTREEVYQALEAQGIHFSQVVHDYVDDL